MGEVDNIVYFPSFGFSGAIGAFYDQFAQVTDKEAIQLLG
jgi:predicted phosphoribosyltransferase